MGTVRASLETGLLDVLKKAIILMPDSFVPKVLGTVIQHESLIAISHHASIFVRTAVIGVSSHDQSHDQSHDLYPIRFWMSISNGEMSLSGLHFCRSGALTCSPTSSSNLASLWS